MQSTDPDTQLRAGGFYGAVVGKVPLTDWIALLGKLGVSVIAGGTICTDACSQFIYSDYAVTAVPLLGAGAQIDLHRRLALRIEYEHFGKVKFGYDDTQNGSNASYKLFTTGILFNS